MINNYFDNAYEGHLKNGLTALASANQVCHAFLDGKPNNKKYSPEQKRQLFWQADWLQVNDLDPAVYSLDAFVLALASYFSFDGVSHSVLLTRVARYSPDSILRAYRYSGMVLSDSHEKWQELIALGEYSPEIAEFVEVCRIFQSAHQDRLKAVQKATYPVKRWSPLEFLCHASLFAFEKLFAQPLVVEGDVIRQDIAWRTLSNIMRDCLMRVGQGGCKLSEVKLANTIKRNLSLVLMPTPLETPAAFKRYQHFKTLFFAQLELDRFLDQSVYSFCYDDSCEFYRERNILLSRTVAIEESHHWQEADTKFRLLHHYWQNRAVQAFTQRPLEKMFIGQAENYERNAVAVISAEATTSRLKEVYGIGDVISNDQGETVDTYQSVQALTLMSAFFHGDYIEPFQNALAKGYSWNIALRTLALDGLLNGMQNRFPLTWSTPEEKAERIKGWTVSKEQPDGSVTAARNIVDFWTADLRNIAADLSQKQMIRIPNLYERPFYKMGEYALQAPWVMATQNNATAMINNLRKVGAKRGEIRDETDRIEDNLASALRARGFRVVKGFHPPAGASDNCGEIDLICALDNELIVIEVKSSYLRSSKPEIWLHKTKTLRRAGEQARKKLAAVTHLLKARPDLFDGLRLSESVQYNTRGWIVDTSIENDHERFSGMLKVSLEEVLIALRDDAYFLAEGSLKTEPSEGGLQTLYPVGFSATAFVRVIESNQIWRECFDVSRALKNNVMLAC